MYNRFQMCLTLILLLSGGNWHLQYHSVVSMKISGKVHHPLHHFSSTQLRPLQIRNEILSLLLIKHKGLYSFPVRILKCACTVVSKPVAKMMNLSIESGMFHSKLKHAKIIPIYKSGHKLECGNYRPISLRSNSNRMFEKLMCNRVKAFVTKHAILCLSCRITETDSTG